MQKLPVSACVGILVLALVGLGAYAFGFIPGATPTTPTTSAPTADSPRTVRWLLSHEPVDVYANAIRVFAAELATASNGRLQLEAITPRQLGMRGEVTHPQIVELLESGTVDVASTYGVGNGVADERFWAWQLPFLFDSYEEIEMAFGSAIGETLLAGLSERSSMYGLAYTLSGGFRILASAEPITTVEQLGGMHIATGGRPVAEATLRAVGAIPVTIATGSVQGEVDAVETTYARLASVVGGRSEYTRFITETNHTLFLTTLVAGKIFYDSLTPEDQQIVTRAARAAAAIERSDAMTLNEKTKAELQASGSVISAFPPEEHAKFVEATRGVYDEFAPTFGNLIPGN